MAPPTPPASVSIVPSIIEGTFHVGDTLQLTVETNIQPQFTTSWSVSDTSIARVTTSGQLIALRVGSGTVRADVVYDEGKRGAAGVASFAISTR
jgi:hypothetical protein